MKITLLFTFGLVFLTIANQAQTVTDVDGNVYNTITIGTQVWMKENLKVTKYRNKDTIKTTKPATLDITAEGSPKYQWAFDGNESNVATYGCLYTWNALNDSRLLCPTGWHVPNDAEWTILETELGGSAIAAGKLKEAGTTHWDSPNTGADNSSGFTALPGGIRYLDGYFGLSGSSGFWWSSTTVSSTNAWRWAMYSDNSILDRDPDGFKGMGFSVRCIKDAASNIIIINNDESIRIYPNPATDKVIINFYKRPSVDMKIYNIVGDCVLQYNLIYNTNEIDISSLSKGVYVIKLTIEEKIIQQKLIKK